MTTHPYPNLNGSLYKLSLHLGHGWVITSHIKTKDEITYPWPNPNYTVLVKGALESITVKSITLCLGKYNPARKSQNHVYNMT